MGVPVEEHASGGQGGQRLGILVMAVGQMEQLAVHQQLRIVSQAGEGKHHLIYLGFAVAPNGNDALLQPGQHGNHLLGGVVPGQIVAGAVIQQVAQENHPVGLLLLNEVHQLLAPIGAAVNIRCNDKFHNHSPEKDG